jgi:hypothetical protein
MCKYSCSDHESRCTKCQCHGRHQRRTDHIISPHLPSNTKMIPIETAITPMSNVPLGVAFVIIGEYNNCSLRDALPIMTCGLRNDTEECPLPASLCLVA